ncbi:MAG: hypothetical protein K2Q12_01140 [Rickettsiales bacterium]|nr:hypothetical protein [Rickettsiales bacterium]
MVDPTRRSLLAGAFALPAAASGGTPTLPLGTPAAAPLTSTIAAVAAAPAPMVPVRKLAIIWNNITNQDTYGCTHEDWLETYQSLPSYDYDREVQSSQAQQEMCSKLCEKAANNATHQWLIERLLEHEEPDIGQAYMDLLALNNHQCSHVSSVSTTLSKQNAVRIYPDDNRMRYLLLGLHADPEQSVDTHATLRTKLAQLQAEYRTMLDFARTHLDAASVQTIIDNHQSAFKAEHCGHGEAEMRFQTDNLVHDALANCTDWQIAQQGEHAITLSFPHLTELNGFISLILENYVNGLLSSHETQYEVIAAHEPDGIPSLRITSTEPMIHDLCKALAQHTKKQTATNHIMQWAENATVREIIAPAQIPPSSLRMFRLEQTRDTDASHTNGGLKHLLNRHVQQLLGGLLELVTDPAELGLDLTRDDNGVIITLDRAALPELHAQLRDASTREPEAPALARH